VEIGTAGVTSPGDFVVSGFDKALARRLDQAFTDHNPEVLWTDNLHQGYARLELTRTQGLVTFLSTPDLERPGNRAEVLNRWRVARGPSGLTMSEI
jgi:alkaline phosphatase D